MVVSRSEIEERWLGHLLPENEAESILQSFNRVEEILGRAWLEAAKRPGVRGPSLLLSMYCLGDQLSVLARATGAEKLVQRLQAREPAALSELHSIALCADGNDIEIEIEPLALVGGSGKVPDFRFRRASEDWVWVEVTEPSFSESQKIAQTVAESLGDLFTDIPERVEVQSRFRSEPSEADLTTVRTVAGHAGMDQTIDRPNFIIHTRAATPFFTPIGNDEHGRPISARLLFRVNGESRAVLSVRVPYTDLRGQQVIDAEARQLPKEGPGLICIATRYAGYWRSLIERSFSPRIRRRISGVLLFDTGLLPCDHGIELQTAGRLLRNPHARVPLPSWLADSLHQLPPTFRTAGSRSTVEDKRDGRATQPFS